MIRQTGIVGSSMTANTESTQEASEPPSVAVVLRGERHFLAPSPRSAIGELRSFLGHAPLSLSPSPTTQSHVLRRHIGNTELRPQYERIEAAAIRALDTRTHRFIEPSHITIEELHNFIVEVHHRGGRLGNLSHIRSQTALNLIQAHIRERETTAQRFQTTTLAPYSCRNMVPQDDWEVNHRMVPPPYPGSIHAAAIAALSNNLPVFVEPRQTTFTQLCRFIAEVNASGKPLHNLSMQDTKIAISLIETRRVEMEREQRAANMNPETAQAIQRALLNVRDSRKFIRPEAATAENLRDYAISLRDKTLLGQTQRETWKALSLMQVCAIQMEMAAMNSQPLPND